MATTYISKIHPINDSNYTEYIIKDAAAWARLDALEGAGYVTSSGVTSVTAGAGLNTTSNDSSSDGGTITTTGTLYLTKSGVTANTYGNTTQQTPAHGGTFNIPYFTVDKYGRITSASTTTVKLPTDNNTDTLVTQTNQVSTNADYRILLSGSANDTTATETANKNTNLRFNPSTQTLSVGGNITASGNLSVTGTSTLSGETSAQSLTTGSLLVNGNANFVQIPTAPTPATGSNDTSIATTAFVKNNLGGLSGAMHFKGTTTTTMSDGLTTAAVTIGGSSYTPEAGDVVLYSDSEFVWTGSVWERLGRDSSFKVTQTAISDSTGTSESTTATRFVYSISQDANGIVSVKTRPLPTYNNYSHPTGDGNLHVPATGTSNNGKFLQAGSTAGSLSWAALPTASSSTAGIMKLDADGGAATYGHTHTTSLATDTGTSVITLESAGKYKLTAGGTSVIFTMPTSNNYSHPTTTAASAAAVKVGKDNLGHVVLGNALTASDVSAFEKQGYNVGTLEAGIRPLIDQSRANRLVFLPADQIIIEKTTDGGTTWIDAGYTDAQKEAVFTENNGAIQIPLLNNAKSTQCGLRVTITGMKYTVPSGTAETAKYSYWKTANVTSAERYFNVREWWFWVSANNDTIRPQIYCATPANPDSWVTVFDTDFGMTGWSGSDWIRAGDGKTFGGGTTQTTNFWNWRLIFWSRIPDGKTAFQSATVQTIQQIRCYGDSVWTMPNNLMAKDHLYSWDNSKNAAFPANVTATQFNGIINGSLAPSSVDIANGDKLVIIDSSNSNKVTPSNTSFDGSTESTVLSKKGTWVSLPTATSLGLSNYILKSTLSGAYDIMYSSAANTPTRLAANTTTTKKFLRMTGTGSAGTAPAWDTVTKSDVGLGNVENTALSTWTGSTAITTLGTISTGTVPLANISGAADLKAIEALSGTSGLLKKTAADTWTLDTNTYVTSSGVTSITPGNGLLNGTGTTAITSTGTLNINYGSSASAVSTTASAGSANTVSRSDHVHSISLATGDNNGQVKIAGTNVAVKGLGSAAYTESSAYATSGHTHYWANLAVTTAASDITEPTMKTIKLIETTGATKSVQLVYDATLQMLDFVFA